jgi:hypothetical protein
VSDAQACQRFGKRLVFIGDGFDTHTSGGPLYGDGKVFRAFDKAT